MVNNQKYALHLRRLIASSHDDDDRCVKGLDV
jgi:hypothetical protein